MKTFDLKQLAGAVMHWLNYTSAVGRDYILSESAIKFPITEYLECLTVDKSEIELEFAHP